MKVIFIDSVHPVLKEMLEAKGLKCVMHFGTTQQELEQIIGNYDGIVIRSRIKLDRNFLSKATQLKFIARSGAGMENIDLDYCQQKNIVCFNSPEGNRDAVGEHAIGMLLALFNQLTKADAEVRKGIRNREGNRGIELSGKTVGIIGFGNMGSAFAKKLLGFDCRIIAHDKYKSGFTHSTIEEVDLETLKKDSDIISLHLPENHECINYMNRDFIDTCSKKFYLINTARGKNVNSVDLADAIRSGKIAGACLDVLDVESSTFEELESTANTEAISYLLQSDKTIFSPHVAGWTTESYYKLSFYLGEKICKHFKL